MKTSLNSSAKSSTTLVKVTASVVLCSIFYVNPSLAQLPDWAEEYGFLNAEVSGETTTAYTPDTENPFETGSLEPNKDNGDDESKKDDSENSPERIDSPEPIDSLEQIKSPRPTKSPEQVESYDLSVEDLKQQMLELNRDLLVLEEELLFPSSTQVSVFLSLDVGTFFQLDSVRLEIDGKQVATHLYTNRQLDALHRGGVQRLHMGNIKSGTHEVTAFFIGEGTHERDYKRAASVEIEKSQEPLMLELVVSDASQKLQPEFKFETWVL